MAIKDLVVDLVLRAKNAISKDTDAADKSVRALADSTEELQKHLQELEDQGSLAAGLERSTKALDRNSAAYDRAQVRLQNLQEKIAQTGEATAKQLNAKTAVVGYTDFPPGKDSLNAFKRGFEAAGGKVIDEIPMGGAGAVPDMTPFFQRAKDKKPDVFFVFVPAGDHALAVVKTYGALGMKDAGIKLIGPGDITQDIKLQAMGDAAIGLITMHHYNADLDNAANKALVASWKKDYGADATPDFVAVGAYDGMAVLAHMIKATKGKITDTLGGVQGFLVTKGAPPEAIDFLKYFVSAEAQKAAAEAGVYVPATKGTSDFIKNPLVKEIAGAIEHSTWHQNFLDQDLGPSVGRVVNDVSVGIAAGDMTPEDGAQQIQDAWDQR